MRHPRKLGAMGLGLVVLAACAGEGRLPGGDTFTPLSTGCVGVCSDAGSGAAPGPSQPGWASDGSCVPFALDGGVAEVSLAELRVGCFGQKVRVRDVVVHALEKEGLGVAGATVVRFWVVDPATPRAGIFVDKREEDLVDGMPSGRVSVGDVVDVEGYLGPLSWFEDHVGYRRALKGMRFFNPAEGGELRILRTGTKEPPPPSAVDLRGGSGGDGGTLLPNPELVGTRLHLTGPLELTDLSPPALRPLNALADAGVSFGYEVTGGILVVDRHPDGSLRLDGGEPEGCDWRARVQDAGSGARVLFGGGIQGVWDTYTHAPCQDGGVDSGCPALRGTVPDAGADFTYVLYPLSCADVAGQLLPDGT